ncbi:MAG: hypothetical protein K0S34_956 [Bacillales bacterium]|jgi:uncharacterized membrane protein|nr:hypothetical protein [Bacillales bacterium]
MYWGNDLRSSDFRREGWEALKGNWFKSVIVFIILNIATGFTDNIDRFFKKYDTSELLQIIGSFTGFTYNQNKKNEAINIEDFLNQFNDFPNNFHYVDIQIFIISIVLGLLLIPLTFGTVYFTLKLIRKEHVEVSDVFSVYKSSSLVVKSILNTITVSIFVFLWSLLLIIPGIIKGISYSLTKYIILDNHDIKNIDAIDLSRKMMNGYKWKYFKLHVSFIGWYILGALTLGIGFIWITPYIETSFAAFYQYVKEQYEA